MGRCRFRVFVICLSAVLCFSNLVLLSLAQAEKLSNEQKKSCKHSKKVDERCPWDCSADSSKAMRVRLCARPSRIQWGKSAKLRWFCHHTQACELTPDIGPLDPHGKGAIKVSPKQTTTYTITGRNGAKTVQSSVTISVFNIPPSISIVLPADGATLTLGTADTVRFEIQYSDDVGIDADSFNARIDDQDITDLFTVTDTGATGTLTTPSAAGIHTLSAAISDTEGNGNTDTSRFTVSYLPPTVSLSASPQTLDFGESATLTWAATNADTLSIEPGIGAVGLNDTVNVTPLETTTYTITATGPGGTATASVTVDIINIPPPGIYYKYDELGRVRQIIRMPTLPNL